MSSISFYDAVKIAAIKNQTTIPTLVKEMNQEGIEGKYNYVYQVLKKQRNNDQIITWFRDKLALGNITY